MAMTTEKALLCDGDQLALRVKPLSHIYSVERGLIVDHSVAPAAKSALPVAPPLVVAPPPSKRRRVEVDALLEAPPGLADPISGEAEPVVPVAAVGTGQSTTTDFKHVLQFKTETVSLPPKWVCDKTNEVLVYGANRATPCAKVAGFDFDKTLVKESGRGNELGATPKFGNTLTKLQDLHDSGYKVVIFTNESVERLKKKEALVKTLERKMERLEDFDRLCKFPVAIFIGIRGGKNVESRFRKPNPGMWEFHALCCNGGVPVNKEDSYYVGDSAGRPQDFHADDKLFAKNAGVRFFTETEFFKG